MNRYGTKSLKQEIKHCIRKAMFSDRHGRRKTADKYTRLAAWLTELLLWREWSDKEYGKKDKD